MCLFILFNFKFLKFIFATTKKEKKKVQFFDWCFVLNYRTTANIVYKT